MVRLIILVAVATMTAIHANYHPRPSEPTGTTKYDEGSCHDKSLDNQLEHKVIAKVQAAYKAEGGPKADVILPSVEHLAKTSFYHVVNVVTVAPTGGTPKCPAGISGGAVSPCSDADELVPGDQVEDGGPNMGNAGGTDSDSWDGTSHDKRANFIAGVNGITDPNTVIGTEIIWMYHTTPNGEWTETLINQAWENPKSGASPGAGPAVYGKGVLSTGTFTAMGVYKYKRLIVIYLWNSASTMGGNVCDHIRTMPAFDKRCDPGRKVGSDTGLDADQAVSEKLRDAAMQYLLNSNSNHDAPVISTQLVSAVAYYRAHSLASNPVCANGGTEYPKCAASTKWLDMRVIEECVAETEAFPGCAPSNVGDSLAGASAMELDAVAVKVGLTGAACVQVVVDHGKVSDVIKEDNVNGAWNAATGKDVLNSGKFTMLGAWAHDNIGVVVACTAPTAPTHASDCPISTVTTTTTTTEVTTTTSSASSIVVAEGILGFVVIAMNLYS